MGHLVRKGFSFSLNYNRTTKNADIKELTKIESNYLLVLLKLLYYRKQQKAFINICQPKNRHNVLYGVTDKYKKITVIKSVRKQKND